MDLDPPSLRTRADRAKARNQVLSCRRCELSDRCRTPVAFHVPPAEKPMFVVIGEAPGRTETRKGRPFVGQSGRTMRRMLRQVGLPPEQAAWMNVVSCWPAGKPKTAHLEACDRNLVAQLKATRADLAVIAGTTAWHVFMPDVALRDLHGAAVQVAGMTAMGVWHPARVEREPDLRATVVEALGRFSTLLAGVTPDMLYGDRCVVCGIQSSQRDERGVPYCSRAGCTSHMGRWRSRQIARRARINNREQLTL